MLLIEAVEGGAYWFICGFGLILGVAVGTEVFYYFYQRWLLRRKFR